MLSYKQYLKEALKLSQYRDIYKLTTKHYLKKYDGWFGKAKRITLPLSGAESDPTYQEVNNKLSTKGYEISSWKDGIAVKKDSDRVIRIGKLLADDKETLQKFNERFKGKKVSEEKEYEVVISRHSYDIAGMSTDRQWDSCKNLTNGSNAYFIPSEINDGYLIAYVIEKGEQTKTKVKLQKIPKQITNEIYDKLTNGKDIFKTRSDDGVVYWLDKDEFYEELQSNQLFRDLLIARFPTNVAEFGLNKFRYNEEVPTKEPLTNPISRLLIVPYINVNDPEDTFLYVPDRTYGKSVTGFRETVQGWLDKKQGKKSGIYCRTKTGYDDKFPAKINKDTGEESLQENPEFTNLKLGSIPLINNGDYLDYAPDRLKRYVVDPKETFPLASFIEEVFIDGHELTQAGVAGGESLKNFFLQTLDNLGSNVEDDEDEEYVKTYTTYYKKLARRIENGTYKITYRME